MGEIKSSVQINGDWVFQERSIRSDLLGVAGGFWALGVIFACPDFRLIPKTRHAEKHFKLLFGLGISDPAELRSPKVRLPGFSPGFRPVEFCLYRRSPR